jgi:hypothetical protein
VDGFSPRLAEVTAVNNLAVRLTELDNELGANLGRLQDDCHHKIGPTLDNLESIPFTDPIMSPHFARSALLGGQQLVVQCRDRGGRHPRCSFHPGPRKKLDQIGSTGK